MWQFYEPPPNDEMRSFGYTDKELSEQHFQGFGRLHIVGSLFPFVEVKIQEQVKEPAI